MNGLLAGLLALAASQTSGSDTYVRTRASGSDPLAACLYWEAGTLSFRQATGGGATEAMHQAVSSSWQTWGTEFARCGNLLLQEGPRISKPEERRVGYDAQAASNTNIVLFRGRDCDAPGVKTGSCADGECGNTFDCWEWNDTTIALTTSTFSRSTGRVLDSDVEMNGARFKFTTVDAPACTGTAEQCTCPDGSSSSCVITDVRNTMTHEVGHVLGLDHAPLRDSTMYFEAQPGETSKRSLDPGSVRFVCEVYPRGLPSQACVVRPVEEELGTVAQGCSAGPGGLATLALAALLRLLPWRKRGRGDA